MDFLLINPPYHRRRGSGVVFPLGLGYVAAAAEQAGFEAAILDCAAQFDSLAPHCLQSFRQWLGQLLPTLSPRLAIGIGPCTTSALRGIVCVADICKSVLPDTPLIFGGPLTGLPDSTRLFFEQLHARVVVAGDGEPVIGHVLRGLLSSTALDGIPGVLTSAEVSGQASVVTNLDTLPMPRRNVLVSPSPYRLSVRRDLFEDPFATIMASRGCPYRCSFCTSGCSRNGVYSRRSAEHIVKEIRHLAEHDRVRTVVFYDDCFFPSASHLENDVICFQQEMGELSSSVQWEIEMRPDIAQAFDQSLAKELYSSGCRQINLGIETCNSSVSETLGKPIHPDLLHDALRRLRKGAPEIRLTGTFILGGPGESEDTIHETIAYAQSLGLLFAHFYPLEVYPGTALYKQKYGSSSADWWYRELISDALPWGEVVYEDHPLDRDSLLRLISLAYQEFYGSSDWRAMAERLLGARFPAVEVHIADWIDDRFALKSGSQ